MPASPRLGAPRLDDESVGEPRATRAIFTVTNTNDSGAGSLRDAIATATSGGTILFHPSLTATGPTTITLTSGELKLMKPFTISGPGADRLAISAGNSSRVVSNTNGAISRLLGLTIRDGHSTETGGGIYNSARLTIQSCVVTSCSTDTYGGGVKTLGQWLRIRDSVFSGNYAYNRGGAIMGNPDSPVEAVRTVFRGNTARFFAGAVHVYSGDLTSTYSECVFYGNRCLKGDGGAASCGGAGRSGQVYF